MKAAIISTGDTMRQTTKSITLVSIFLISLFSGIVYGTEQAEASQVVITEAVRIVDCLLYTSDAADE